MWGERGGGGEKKEKKYTYTTEEMPDKDDHNPSGNIATSVQTPECMGPAIGILDGVRLDLLQGLGRGQGVVRLDLALEICGGHEVERISLAFTIALALALALALAGTAASAGH